MASTTPNIGLTLPTGAEKVSRQIINANNTIIDSKMGAVPGGQNLQGEIDALNSKTTRVQNFGIGEIQAELVTSVTIAANSAGMPFNNVNLKTGNVLKNFSVGTINDIPDTVKGIVYLWSNNSSCIAIDTIAWDNGKVSMNLKNISSSSVTITSIRLLLFGYYS